MVKVTVHTESHTSTNMWPILTKFSHTKTYTISSSTSESRKQSTFEYRIRRLLRWSIDLITINLKIRRFIMFCSTFHLFFFFNLLYCSYGIEPFYTIWIYVQTSLLTTTTKCHRKQTLAPANFHPNRQRPWPSFSGSKIQIKYTGTFTRDYLASGDIMANIRDLYRICRRGGGV